MKFSVLLVAAMSIGSSLVHSFPLVDEQDIVQYYKRHDNFGNPPGPSPPNPGPYQPGPDRGLPPTSCSTSTSATPTSTGLNNKTAAHEFIVSFWDTFMNPADNVEAKKINSTFFTENSLGRISMTRDFIGRELNTEYIFGLFSDLNPVVFRMIGVPLNYTLVNFVFDDNFVVTNTISMFYVDLMDYYIPIQIDMWYQLDGSSGSYEIAEYDAVFRYFDEAFNLTNNAAKAALAAKYPNSTETPTQLLKNLAIESICSVAEKYCTGDNLQYNNYDDCYSFLQNKRLGESFEGGRDTVFCRNIHQVMLPFRPSVHCAHVGQTGGDMCRDNDTTYDHVIDTYQSYFTTLFDDFE